MANQIGNIHDALFKRALSDPHRAGMFLREHLPPEVVDLLSPEAPVPVPASFVDEKLREHHADLIFRVRLKEDRHAFAYVLVEHKSSPDPGARLQLLRYLVRLLSDWYVQHKQRLPLPLVFPFLAHHGPGGWGLSCEFADLFGTVPERLRRYLPSFRHALVDFGTMEDRALSADVPLRAYWKTLKYSQCSNLPDYLGTILADTVQMRKEDSSVILNYLDKGSFATNIKETCEALLGLAPHGKEQIMGWLAQAFSDLLRAELEAKGKAEGKAEGRAEGEAKIFSRVLEKRFGAIPAALRERIFAADTASIEAWSDRLLDAHDLQSVFDSN